MANTHASNTEPYNLQTISNAHVSSYSNVVTQSPSLGDSTDAQLTTPSNINLQTDFMAVEHHYHDTFISFQYSEATTPTVAYTNTPMVHFPNQALIKDLLPPI